MSYLPEQAPFEPENLAPPQESVAQEPIQLEQKATELAEPLPQPDASPTVDPQTTEPAAERLLFQEFFKPDTAPPVRIPHLGHFCILCLLALCGLFCAGLLARAALYFHLFGISTVGQAATDIHYTLGSEAILYLLTLGLCLLVFPPIWHERFFAGLHWRGATALQLRQRLFGAAALCFLLAIVSGELMPGPSNAPIDRIFRAPGAAWLLFAFGITLAPFFEELAFRGFLLPALCTACDWTAEKATDTPPRPLDEYGHPQWSLPAMGIASVLTSLPFALMHAEQTGYSLGPFLLLVGVSLVLCWVRLSTRSLASSVLVHASYNFLLFSLMMFGTGGFRHLEKM